MLMKIEIVLFCFVIAICIVDAIKRRNFDCFRACYADARRADLFRRFVRLRVRDIRDRFAI